MSRATTGRRTVTAVVLTAFLVGAGGSTAAPAARPEPTVRNLDLAASANPSVADPVVANQAFSVAASTRREVRSDVTATGSAVCDGCDATGSALQVLYVDHGRAAHLDNTAVAWTQGCADCTAAALSVQVVVLRGVRTIVPNNRALAVNAACDSCTAGSLAFQVVVSSSRAGQLSDDALDSLRAWFGDQLAALRDPPPALVAPGAGTARREAVRHARRAARSALGNLEHLVAGDLGGVTVSADVDRSR